jgi:uncharacterized protein
VSNSSIHSSNRINTYEVRRAPGHSLARASPCIELVIAGQYPAVKILAISDQEVEQIYDLVPQGHFSDVEMIISCGDLRYEYLEYLVTVLNVELFYVPGNHDPEDNADSPAARAAGCTNLDLGTTRAKGLLLAGFGGSIRYRPEGVNQYTQTVAFLRAAKLLPSLWRNRLRYGRALDILVTHSPPFGVHDDNTHAHRGLKAINWLLDWTKARYHLHGHIHFAQSNIVRDVLWQGTTSVMNVYPYRLIEIPDV